MFSGLTNFGQKRTVVGAVGFYIAWFVFILIVGTFIGLGLHISMPQYSANEGRIIATGFASLVSLALSLFIIQAKNLNTSIPLLLLSLCAAILAANGGALLGLLIPSFLSTLGGGTHKSHKKKSRKR